MAQDDSPNRDVSELGVEDLQTFDELKRHMSIGMRAYTKRYRAAAAKDKAEVAKTRPTADVYHPLLSKLCLLYTSPSPRDLSTSRMPSSA